MNFFKSVFSDDPEQSVSETTSTSSPDSQPQTPNPSSANPNPTPKVTTVTNAWTFGSSLIKAIASKSESVIETYRRDLEEFSSGLKKETAVIREAASRAVKDLPTSLEAGAAAAQESLESVGQAIDDLGSTVTEFIAHGKESILADDDSDSDISDAKQIISSQRYGNSSSKPYSRLDAQIRTIQGDMNAYLEEPEDLDDYNDWKLGFVLDEKVEEIKDLIGGNGVIEEIYNEIVPARVDETIFWTRYFYRVSKVKKAEEVRAKLVKRAISGEEDEELTWDVDEDDYEESNGSKLKADDSKEQIKENDSSAKDMGKSDAETEQERFERENDEKMAVSPEKDMWKEEVETEPKSLKKENEDDVGVSECENGVDQNETLESRSDDSNFNRNSMEAKSEAKTDKDSDFSVVSSQPSREEEDGWDEIEDIGSSDEIKMASRGSPNRADLRRRLSATEAEEDLTWDIEDDDEPVRS